jgi:ubiquinone/menaquinone biosynthesis C-methylase UbiE
MEGGKAAPESQFLMQTEDYQYLYDLEEHFWWFEGMRKITANLLDPVCPPGPNRAVLDAGCGTGGNLEWLRRYAGNGRISGIDLMSDALKFCRQREHRMLAQASIIALPFNNAVFDLVTSFDVLPQLPLVGADAEALGEMARVLKPGGIIFARAAAYPWLRSGHDEALQTHQRYYLGTFCERIERAGFRVLRATYANSLLLPIVISRRLVLKRLRLVDHGSDVKPFPPGLQWLNSALKLALLSEALWLKNLRLQLPAGLSAICVARKAGGGS